MLQPSGRPTPSCYNDFRLPSILSRNNNWVATNHAPAKPQISRELHLIGGGITLAGSSSKSDASCSKGMSSRISRRDFGAMQNLAGNKSYPCQQTIAWPDTSIRDLRVNEGFYSWCISVACPQSFFQIPPHIVPP
jgi:hypothetical protein